MTTQGPPMIVDQRSLPKGWVCNARIKPGVSLPSGLSLGAVVSIHESYPASQLVADGYVGLYDRQQCAAALHTGEARTETVELDSPDELDTFDNVDLFGDGDGHTLRLYEKGHGDE